MSKPAKLSFKTFRVKALVLVVQIGDSNPASDRFRAICRTNAFSSCPNWALAKLTFFQPVDQLMEIKNDMGPVTDEYSILGIQTLLFQCLELLKERWDMYDTAATNEVDTGGIDKAWR